MLSGLKPLGRFNKKSKGDLKGSLMAIATIFIVLYVLVIVLGNLVPVMEAAVPANSTLQPAVDSLQANTTTFFTVAALVGVIGVAILIINILS
jgi:hypothetical protein